MFLSAVLTRRSQFLLTLTLPDDSAGKLFFSCSFSPSCVLIVVVLDVRMTAVSCGEESEYQTLCVPDSSPVLIRRIRKPLLVIDLPPG